MDTDAEKRGEDIFGSPLELAVLGALLGGVYGGGKRMLDKDELRLNDILYEALTGAAIGGAAGGALGAGVHGYRKMNEARKVLDALPTTRSEQIRAVIEAAKKVPRWRRSRFMFQHGVNPYSASTYRIIKEGAANETWKQVGTGALVGGLGLGLGRALIRSLSRDPEDEKDSADNIARDALLAAAIGAGTGGLGGYTAANWDALRKLLSSASSSISESAKKLTEAVSTSPAIPNDVPTVPSSWLNQSLSGALEGLWRYGSSLGHWFNWSAQGTAAKGAPLWLLGRTLRNKFYRGIEKLTQSEEGKLKLLRELFEADAQPLTKAQWLRRKLLHRALGKEMPLPKKDLVGYVNTLFRVSPPGEGVSYNPALEALAAVEKQNNPALVEDFFKQHVVDPLKQNAQANMPKYLAEANAQAVRMALKPDALKQIRQGVSPKDVVPKVPSRLGKSLPWLLMLGALLGEAASDMGT